MEKIHRKEIEKPVVSHVVALCSGAVGVDATALSLQKSINYNTLDLLGDPILWTPFLPPESSYTSEVRIPVPHIATFHRRSELFPLDVDDSPYREMERIETSQATTVSGAWSQLRNQELELTVSGRLILFMAF
ncbi:unnamed protein product [Brassica rapa subsp. trilocularis]